jgi:hypothetical protein
MEKADSIGFVLRGVFHSSTGTRKRCNVRILFQALFQAARRTRINLQQFALNSHQCGFRLFAVSEIISVRQFSIPSRLSFI